MTIALYLVGGALLLIFGAEVLVRGASGLAKLVGLSPLVIGLTVVAIGTSSPEIAVTIMSCLHGKTSMALGNVVGSNICNILLILGLCAAASPLIIRRSVMYFHGPVMAAATFLTVYLCFSDSRLSPADGCILILAFVGYLAFSVLKARRETLGLHQDTGENGNKSNGKHIFGRLLAIVLGLVCLVYGSDFVVDGASAIAKSLGMSELAIGLTIVAVGTSLPELATSLVGTFRGEREIAIGNVVGSNIANLLLILGSGCLVSGGMGIEVTGSVMSFDIPVMVAVTVICLPLFISHSLVSRSEGLLLLGGYGLYVLHTAWGALNPTVIPLLTKVFIGYGVLALLVVMASMLSHLKGPREKQPGLAPE